MQRQALLLIINIKIRLRPTKCNGCRRYLSPKSKGLVTCCLWAIMLHRNDILIIYTHVSLYKL